MILPAEPTIPPAPTGGPHPFLSPFALPSPPSLGAQPLALHRAHADHQEGAELAAVVARPDRAAATRSASNRPVHRRDSPRPEEEEGRGAPRP
jgi:hypothetical protein